MTLLTKGMGKILKGKLNKFKTKGSMETDAAVRYGIALAKKDMKKKGFIGPKKKPIPSDLTYVKGILGE